MSKPTLHGVFLSGPTYKAGLMLSLTGTPFAYRHVDLRGGKHKAPEFLALNRYGQVPCLEIDGMALCQSGAILEYLAEKTGKLRGADALTRARAREWIFWDFDRLAPGIYRVRAAELGFRQFAADVLADLKVQGKAALDVIES
ncbi:MAG: glutathione S-transferase, partial [Alphaproteobacteria bacterium]|nr:glutathione S-transferase [Alphaproteobacteria bacterium]